MLIYLFEFIQSLKREILFGLFLHPCVPGSSDEKLSSALWSTSRSLVGISGREKLGFINVCEWNWRKIVRRHNNGGGNVTLRKSLFGLH
ncbi:hypothetical protein NPIL_92371 [Nephila pilipes]|uniref:Uncharacterized protein n=1 Tax=Nephila pilipes TaxID=299642 RepID=A0A8X6P9S3_NEPPI|nr:hypothetical protein NPIL_92371 [Nephila pilipes]